MKNDRMITLRLPEGLYAEAVERWGEGNFSRNVRGLIYAQLKQEPYTERVAELDAALCEARKLTIQLLGPTSKASCVKEERWM